MQDSYFVSAVLRQLVIPEVSTHPVAEMAVALAAKVERASRAIVAVNPRPVLETMFASVEMCRQLILNNSSATDKKQNPEYKLELGGQARL